MKDLERVLKALANKRRLTILKYLKRNSKATVGDIAEEINLSFKATSKHLGILATVDIVEREQKSLEVWYYISKSQKSAAKLILTLL